MNLRERYRPIALASNILVSSSFCVLAALLLLRGGLNLVNIAIGSGIILVSNLAFVGSGMATPNLVAPGKIAFPLNFTLPLVFGGWVAVVSFITWRIGNPLEPTLEVFQLFAAMFGPWDWVIHFSAQVLAMSISVARSNRPQLDEGVESP